MHWFSSEDAQQLLHNKFVVVLGDSIQRSVYKDLVKLLKEDDLLSDAQIKGRGELEFEKDTLVEGGMLTGMHNGTTYREVRQYRTGHHLVRFYFLTRVYSDYLESILSDFKSGPQPDVVIVNSCVWDLLRYYEEPLETYKTNLDILFRRLKVVLGPQCLLLWTMTMPVGYRDYEMPENVRHNLRGDIMEGNLFGAVLADFHRLDVLDMHYHFRWNLHLRWHDAVHWNQIAHRKYTQILLIHIAQAWGVEAPKFKMPKGFSCHPAPPHLVTLRGDPYPGPYPTIHRQERCNQAPFPFGNDIPQMPNNMTPGFFGPPGFNGHFAPPHQFALRGDPYPGPHPSIQEQERCNQAPFPFGTDNPLLTANIGPGFFSPQGFSGHFAPPHQFALRGDPYPGPHPSIQEQERCNQGFSGPFAPPHPFALRGDPYPGPHPSIQEQERCNQGFSGHFAPPHPFVLRGDPYPGPHPSIQERERCNQAPFFFGTTSPQLPDNMEDFFPPPGFTVPSAPPRPYPGPHLQIQDQEQHNQGPFPCMTDGPQPSDTMEGNFPPSPGPEVSSPPFSGRKVLLSTPSLMNLHLAAFPNHAPYSQKPLKKKMKRNRGKMKPNPCPP